MRKKTVHVHVRAQLLCHIMVYLRVLRTEDSHRDKIWDTRRIRMQITDYSVSGEPS